MKDEDFRPSYQSRSEQTRITGKATVRKTEPAALKGLVLVVSGPGVGDVTLIEAPPLLIGRDSSCGLVLQDPHVSKSHGRLDRNGRGDFVFEDIDSKNGSFVNGKRCRGRIALKAGDQIICGKTVLRFLMEERVKP